MILENGAKAIQWSKDSLSTRASGTIIQPHVKEWMWTKILHSSQKLTQKGSQTMGENLNDFKYDDDILDTTWRHNPREK